MQVNAGVGAVQVWEGEAGQTSPPAGAPFAITKADGTFTMWEKAFTDGPVTIVAKAPGGEIKAAAWELLCAMLAFEAAFGVPGLVAAPIFYAYGKAELRQLGLI